MTKLDEQFDVLSNSLRLLSEDVLKLHYFIKEINEPEEGISNIEAACTNVFNNIYGVMVVLKDDGAFTSMYEHGEITTILCIRHIVQHQGGRLKNNLRDAWSGSVKGTPALIKYSASDPEMPDQPFYINIAWFQDGISNSNNSKKTRRHQFILEVEPRQSASRGRLPFVLDLHIYLRHDAHYSVC